MRTTKRVTGAALVATALLVAGCGSAEDNAKLVDDRYGECLSSLNAHREQTLDHYVTYVTDAGFLTFHIGTYNGKTLTTPDKATDERILATVGC
jgi:hypothetical protein